MVALAKKVKDGASTSEQANRHAVRAILPGHDERLPPRTQDINQTVARMNKFRTSRYADGMDAIEIADWKNNHCYTSISSQRFPARFRSYLATIQFIEESMEQKVYMLQVEGDIQK